MHVWLYNYIHEDRISAQNEKTWYDYFRDPCKPWLPVPIPEMFAHFYQMKLRISRTYTLVHITIWHCICRSISKVS